MNTHLADPNGNRQGAARVYTVCNVTCDREQIVTKNPNCTWCQRWLEQRTLNRIAGASDAPRRDDGLPF